MTRRPLEYQYLDAADAVERFLESLGTARTVAIDTEGASFHKFVDRIYLLQLSAGGKNAVIDPLPIGKSPALRKILESRDIEVVFHDADYDLRLLHQDYGWQTRRIFDTRIAAQLIGLKAFGLAALLEQYLGLRLDKKHQRADWSMRPLTEDMLEYAAQDTAYLLELRDILADLLEKKGRRAWADEEFARLEGTRWAAEEPGQAFLRVKGARDLNRRELARLRELVIWRDALAAKLDRSTFRVISNDVLLEAVKVEVPTRDMLAALKGMPRSIVDRYGAELVDAVARGDKVKEALLPRFPKGPRFTRDPDFDNKVGQLKAVRDKHAATLELDPGVLCSRERLEAIARRLPRAVEDLASIPELRKWQTALMGEEFVTALQSFKGGPATVEDDSPYKD
jgi:ribonuclease D